MITFELYDNIIPAIVVLGDLTPFKGNCSKPLLQKSYVNFVDLTNLEKQYQFYTSFIHESTYTCKTCVLT